MLFKNPTLGDISEAAAIIVNVNDINAQLNKKQLELASIAKEIEKIKALIAQENAKTGPKVNLAVYQNLLSSTNDSYLRVNNDLINLQAKLIDANSKLKVLQTPTSSVNAASNQTLPITAATDKTELTAVSSDSHAVPVEVNTGTGGNVDNSASVIQTATPPVPASSIPWGLIATLGLALMS